jgi:polysaccharide biosynthesis/export protein
MISIKSSLYVIVILIAILAISCITNEKLTYLQKGVNISDTTGAVPNSDTARIVQPATYKVQPYDNLFIRVVTPDPQWSDMFNTIQTTSSSGSLTEQSADLISYSVDEQGYIELPYAGKFKVSDKSLNIIKTDLESALKAYVADAAVTVKMINNYINIIGEVKNPGRYPIYKDRMNIFQALAMAGDLGDYSDRMGVQIIRPTVNGSVIKEFSLKDRSILVSEFFYVMPNDVIYAKPLKGRFFQLNAFPYGIILSTITTFILFLNVLQ